MAKFKAGNLDLKTNQLIDFSDGFGGVFMTYDGTDLYVNVPLKAEQAVKPEHLVRLDQLTTVSGYLQNQIDGVTFITLDDTPSTYSGSEDYYLRSTGSGIVFSTVDHGELDGLQDDDHLQYVPRTGSRGFTGTVSGIPPIEDNDLVTKKYFLDSIDPTASGSVGNILFGDFYVFELENAESSTTSTTYVQKLRLTTDTVPSGVYRVGWHFEWRISKSNEQFYYRVQLDDTTVLSENFKSPVVDVNEWQSVNNFYYLPALSSGIHYLDIDYRSSSTGSTAYIKEARMEFWRVI